MHAAAICHLADHKYLILKSLNIRVRINILNTILSNCQINNFYKFLNSLRFTEKLQR